MSEANKAFHMAIARAGRNVYFAAFYEKLLDEAAFFAANSLVEDVFVLTTDFHLNLLRPLTEGLMKSVGTVTYQGKNQILAEAFDQSFDVEIGPNRLAGAADFVGLVGLEAVQRQSILARVDRHGADIHLRSGAHHADGDFRAVRDHQFLDGADRGGRDGLLGHRKV